LIREIRIPGSIRAIGVYLWRFYFNVMMVGAIPEKAGAIHELPLPVMKKNGFLNSIVNVRIVN
jgi:hypothetical protein